MKTYLLFILILMSFHSAKAQVDPSIDWKVLEEDHAIWIYDSRHKNLAEQYARNFKRIFPYLQQMFHEVPDKTTFVISDYTDLPNGSATVFPYPVVTIYPVIPIPASPIGETDDSFFEIVTHEYTHILNLNPVHGFLRPFSWVFGSIVRPNMYLPRWYSEGLAVFTESYFNPKGGRLRSQNFEGLMRAMGRDDVWSHYKIDQLNDFQPDWIGGRRAYLLGGALMHNIATGYGLETIGELNEHYSRRIPFFIKGPVDEKTGKGYVQLLAETYGKLQKSVNDQLRTIQSARVTRGSALALQGQHNHLPRFSPNGKYLAYVMRDHNIPGAINLVTRDEKNTPLKDLAPKSVAFGTEMDQLAWSSNSRLLAYTSAETFKRFYVFSDIYIYDVEKKKSEKLTKGARASDLIFINQDKSLLFVQNIAGSKQLAQIDLASKKISTLYTPTKLGTNLFGLLHLNGVVLFIEQNQEKKVLKTFSLGSGQTQTLNENVATTYLQKTTEGLILTSSRSGVDNLYLVKDLNGSSDPSEFRALTNSETRIYDGDIDPIDKTLYYSEQTSNSVAIFAQPKSEWSQIKTAPPVKPLLSIPTPKKLDTPANDNLAGQEKDFSPWPYLWPRYWMPFLYALDGGMGFQASTGALDPLGKNAYSVLAEWDTLTKKAGGAFLYSNTSTPVQIDFDANQVYRYFYASDLTLKDSGAGLGGTLAIPFLWKSWTTGLGWRHSTTNVRNRQYERSGVEAHVSYNSAVRRGYQISPESGTGFSILHQGWFEDLGNLGYDKTNITFRQFFPSFLERHAFMFQLNGTYAPELWNKSAIFHTSSVGGNFVTNQLVQPFLVRGYPSGNLIGYNMGTASLEYRFPIWRIYEGFTTAPFFVKQLHGAVVGDVASLDGQRYSGRAKAFVPTTFGDKYFGGYGLEVNLETTLGYFLPATFTLGLYQGADRDTSDRDYNVYFMFNLF